MRLNRSTFIKWLRAKPPAEVVGEKRDCHSCPLANFYVEASGGFEVVIFDREGEYFIDRGYSQRPLPAWAENFVSAIDRDKSEKITALGALKHLTNGVEE